MKAHADNLKLDSVAKNNFRILTRKLHKALCLKLKVFLQNLRQKQRESERESESERERRRGRGQRTTLTRILILIMMCYLRRNVSHVCWVSDSRVTPPAISLALSRHLLWIFA